jgi:hypothetical protein
MIIGTRVGLAAAACADPCASLCCNAPCPASPWKQYCIVAKSIITQGQRQGFLKDSENIRITCRNPQLHGRAT